MEQEATKTTFSRAGQEDVDKVWAVVSACAVWLDRQKGLDHWSSYYTREMIEKKINTQEVIVVKVGDEVIGTVSLDPNAVDYYTPEQANLFTGPDEPALYVSALAVKPEYQGRGTASTIMEYVDKLAASRGIKHVRFDCREEYTELVNFYLKRGYQKVGSFDEGEGQNYLLMEKNLS